MRAIHVLYKIVSGYLNCDLTIKCMGSNCSKIIHAIQADQDINTYVT